MSEDKKNKESGIKNQADEGTKEEITPPQASDWETKASEYLSDLQRLQAEFENFKKRLAKDQAEMTKFMVQGLVTDLIPILDNFHAAVAHVPETEKGSPWVTGITYIEKQFEDVLANYGVKPLEVKPGDAFDPSRHEALDHEQKDQEAGIGNQAEEKEIVAKVIQKGYAIKERVIRPAKVIVKNHNS